MRMANEGEWRPVFEFLSEAIARQTGDPALHRGGEGDPGVLAAYLSVTDFYVFRSEAELGKGTRTSHWNRWRGSILACASPA